MDERRWVQAIQKGNKQYFQDIAEEYYDDIYRFCAFRTGSGEDAYDMAQETFLRFIRYVEGYHDRNLKGYLLTIAMNVCRDYLGRKGREEALILRPEDSRQWDEGAGASGSGKIRLTGEGCIEISERASRIWETASGEGGPGSPGASPENHAVEADVHHRLMQALALLPGMQREAILLHYLYDMKYREIGRLTGVSASTAKSRVRQGLDRLQGILRREDFLD